jgi:hypothetical protein
MGGVDAGQSLDAASGFAGFLNLGIVSGPLALVRFAKIICN